MAKGNLSGKVLAGLMAMAMLIPTMALADGGQTADAQTTGSTSTSPTAHAQQATDTNQASSTSIQTSTPQLDTAASEAAQTTQQSKSTASNQAAPVQPSRKPTVKSAIKDMLDTDDAVVTTLSQASRSTGTAPFDNDNNPGNDHDADNDIAVSYTHLTLPTNREV